MAEARKPIGIGWSGTWSSGVAARRSAGGYFGLVPEGHEERARHIRRELEADLYRLRLVEHGWFVDGHNDVAHVSVGPFDALGVWCERTGGVVIVYGTENLGNWGWITERRQLPVLTITEARAALDEVFDLMRKHREELEEAGVPMAWVGRW